MSPVEWAAIVAAIVAALAKLAELLGEHLAGTIIGGIIVWFYIQREKEHKADMKSLLEEAQKREDKLFALVSSTDSALETFVESCSLDDRLRKLEAASERREVKGSGRKT